MLNRRHENALGSLDFRSKIWKIFENSDQITSYLSDFLLTVCFMASNHRVAYFGTPDFSPLNPMLKKEC